MCRETELWLYSSYGVYKHKSFTITVILRRFRRLHLKNLSTYLYQVHGLSSKERKPYLEEARSTHDRSAESRNEPTLFKYSLCI